MLQGPNTIMADTVKLETSPIARFTKRVGQGAYLYRAEASLTAAKLGARYTGRVITRADSATGWNPTGFGMSDVLVATSAAPSTTVPHRWTDFKITPLLAPATRDDILALLWENYELASDSGRAKYSVTVSVERERSQPGRIAAGIVRGIAGAIGVNRTPDRVEFTFDRDVPYAAALVDNIDLSLADTPPGNYRLSVKILDRTSGRTTSWMKSLAIE
jgi:hypothetical protein